MITIGTYFKTENLDQLLVQLSKAPTDCQPIYFGSNENAPSTKNRVDLTENYQQFREKNRQGYFLFSKCCRYDVTASHLSGYGTLFADPFDRGFEDKEATFLFDDLNNVGEFTFASQESEFHSRNQIRKIIGNNDVQAWVGRDLGKYVPGLYWLTGAKSDIVTRFALSGLTNILREKATLDEQGRLRICFGAASSNWREWEEQAADLCDSYPGLFSIRNVHAEVSKATDYKTLSDTLGRWR